jgi:ATP-dependent protease ClpP protease subunit
MAQAETQPRTNAPIDQSAKASQSPVYLSIINELNQHQDQLQKRQALIKQIEELLTTRYAASNRLISYIFRFGHPRSSMASNDIASFADVLKSVSGAEQINIILHSPGGDGTIVEKMVDMCRSHLSGNNTKLRVIVPNIAKSAATVLALGADSILMGYCSELGPIDPQVPISVSGVTQWVSALAFVQARDDLMEQIAEASKKNKPIAGLLQQLAGLNIPFTVEMLNWINFSEKTAETLLDKYMLRSKFPKAAARKKKAREIATKLLSKQLFPVHGQFIDGPTASQLELEVELLDKGDALWEKLWEYYIRCEVQMNMQLQPPMIKIKLFESSLMSLVVQDTAN